MQLNCRQCGSLLHTANPTVPCPQCGFIEASLQAQMHSPNTQFSVPISQPDFEVSALPVPVSPHQALVPSASVPIDMYTPPNQPVPQAAMPMQPQPAAYNPNLGQPQNYGPQPINIVVQNQIVPPTYYPTQPAVYPAPQMVQSYVPYVRQKDPGVATLLSFFLPGSGQLYNGHIGKGIVFLMVMFFINLPLMFVGVGFLTGLITWIWAMADAHSSANQINLANAQALAHPTNRTQWY